jgi:hypothetical protein
MGNNLYGDCAFAAMGHAVQTWTADNGAETTVTDAAVLAAYAGCTGFDPNDPSTDNGTTLLAALRWWRTTGVGGHKIGAFAKVDHHNIAHVKAAIDLFGGVYTGAALPRTAQGESRWVGPKGSLTGDNAPWSWGGHALWTPHYDRSGVGMRTWGRIRGADWQWWIDYVDECYAPISDDWLTDAKPAPNGLDLAKLRAYLAAL